MWWVSLLLTSIRYRILQQLSKCGATYSESDVGYPHLQYPLQALQYQHHVPFAIASKWIIIQWKLPILTVIGVFVTVNIWWRRQQGILRWSIVGVYWFLSLIIALNPNKEMVSSFERYGSHWFDLSCLDWLTEYYYCIKSTILVCDMKIKGGTEPPSNEIDKYALTINSLIAAVTRDDFIELLRLHTPLTTEAMVWYILYYLYLSIMTLNTNYSYPPSLSVDGPDWLEGCVEQDGWSYREHSVFEKTSDNPRTEGHSEHCYRRGYRGPGEGYPIFDRLP